MEYVTLRRAGGSLTLTIPRPVARELGLEAGGKLGVSVAEGKLVATPTAQRRRYSLDELLAECDPSAPLSAEDEAWLNDKPRGSELI